TGLQPSCAFTSSPDPDPCGRLGEQPSEPRLPGQVGLLLIYLEEEVVSDDHRATVSAEKPVQCVARAQSQGVRIDEIYDALGGRGRGWGEPHRVACSDRAGQSQFACEHRPRTLPVRHWWSKCGDGRRRTAGEVREVLRQRAEEHLEALGGCLVLRLPVVAGEKTTGHDAQHGAPTITCFNAELVCDEPSILSLAAAVGEPLEPVPCDHSKLWPVVAKD